MNMSDDDSARYKVVRSFFNSDIRPRTIKTNLTLAEAQAHCKDPETSSSTCKGRVGRERTRRCGPWFDGYDKCTKR
jgi:hypothetical protein